MAIFYGLPKTQQRRGFVSYLDQDATGLFLKNYRQYLLLDFMSKNSADYADRAQAIKELEHCERTLLRWKLQPNWDERIALGEVEQLKKTPMYQLIAEMMSEGDEE